LCPARCPEDWWLPVITQVATLVDNYADTDALRDYFVGGKPGKEEIVVEVPNFNIYDVDYNQVFLSFSQEINKRITVPDYVSTITASFSTTTPDQRIGSQITIMSSFQKYFDYTMVLGGCGLRAVEMAGTEQDWALLLEKLSSLRKLLSPIESTLGISEYFNTVEVIYKNLLKTYQGDPEMCKWWSTVLIDSIDYEYGPSGSRRAEVQAYNGWLVFFCSGKEDLPLKASKLAAGEYPELSNLTTCPMKIVDVIRKLEDNSQLVAGVLGWRECTDAENEVTSLQPVHGWALLLPEKSPLRSK